MLHSISWKLAPARQAPNRRAPRVFAAVPESKMMDGTSEGAQRPKPKTPAPRGNWHGRARMKLIGVLRGDGHLVWPDLVLPVSYELDIFDMGAMRSVSGSLEGDFAALLADQESDSAQKPGARLRLSDDRELAVDLIALEPFTAAIEAQGVAVDGLLVR